MPAYHGGRTPREAGCMRYPGDSGIHMCTCQWGRDAASRREKTQDRPRDQRRVETSSTRGPLTLGGGGGANTADVLTKWRAHRAAIASLAAASKHGRRDSRRAGPRMELEAELESATDASRLPPVCATHVRPLAAPLVLNIAASHSASTTNASLAAQCCICAHSSA